MFRKIIRKLRNDRDAFLWKEIKKGKLGVQFHRQIPVSEYIMDFYCHELKLAIEIDKGSKKDIDQKQKDFKRDYALAKLGIITIRFKELEVNESLGSVVELLKDNIKERSLHLAK